MHYGKSIMVVLGLGLVAGCSTGGQQLRIDCGDTDVILNEEEAIAVRAGSTLTNAELAIRVCDIFKDVDTSGYEDMKHVTVRTPSGAEYTGMIQKSMN